MVYILVSVALALWALSFTKFEIRKTVDINAPIEQVWSAIIAFEDYGRWNSQLSYLGGQVAYGETLQLKLSAAGASPYTFAPRISVFEAPHRFAWLARTGLPRVFDGEHFFELTTIHDQQTRVVNREEYRGILSLVIRQLPAMKLAPDGFVRMNAELKAYVEGRAI